MKTKTILLLTAALLLVSCEPATPFTPTDTSAPTEKPTSTSKPSTAAPTTTPRPMASSTPKPNRTASFGTVENTVEARDSETDEFAAAFVGTKIPVGGQARTGADGRARLDLSPDETIIRLAPNTLFAVTALEEKEDDPFTLLELFIGQIYIILSGGELEVHTPSGVAAVRGSMLGVFYNPELKLLTATCLEGHCSLGIGTNVIELIEGQAADIIDGLLSDRPRLITDEELLHWLESAPELRDHLDSLPNLRDRIDNLPQLPDPGDLPDLPRLPRLPRP